jgi:hypothetical protein
MRVVTSVSILLANIATLTASSYQNRNRCKHHTECPAPDGFVTMCIRSIHLFAFCEVFQNRTARFSGEAKQGAKILIPGKG